MMEGLLGPQQSGEGTWIWLMRKHGALNVESQPCPSLSLRP